MFLYTVHVYHNLSTAIHLVYLISSKHNIHIMLPIPRVYYQIIITYTNYLLYSQNNYNYIRWWYTLLSSLHYHHSSWCVHVTPTWWYSVCSCYHIVLVIDIHVQHHHSLIYRPSSKIHLFTHKWISSWRITFTWHHLYIIKSMILTMYTCVIQHIHMYHHYTNVCWKWVIFTC